MSQLKIYNISKRTTPFTPASTEGDFINHTAKIFNENKIDVRVFLPRYGYISERKYILREVIRLKEIRVTIDGEELISSVKSAFIPDSRVQVYFHIYPDFYREISKQVTSNYLKPRNPNVYNTFLMYSFASLNTLERLYWKPDVILCYNWQSAMIPVILKTILKDHEWFRNIKVVSVLSSDEPFFAFTGDSLQRFHIGDDSGRLSDAEDFLKTSLSFSDAVIKLKSKKNGKLDPLLKKKDINKVLSDKKEHYKIFDINTSNNNIEYWGPIAKELYEFLDTL